MSYLIYILSLSTRFIFTYNVLYVNCGTIDRGPMHVPNVTNFSLIC